MASSAFVITRMQYACLGHIPNPLNHEKIFSWNYAIRLLLLLPYLDNSSFSPSVSLFCASLFSQNFVENSVYPRCRKFSTNHIFSNILVETRERIHFIYLQQCGTLIYIFGKETRKCIQNLRYQNG